jgi:hypothetical protein
VGRKGSAKKERKKERKKEGKKETATYDTDVCI